MPFQRPKFNIVKANFVRIYGKGDLIEVGDKIGGKVKYNIDLGVKDPNIGFTNGCAIRMSYALNQSGVFIPQKPWKTVSGEHGRWYIYRVKDLITFLKTTFGEPDRSVKQPKPQNFKGQKGIIVFNVDWQDATGHATLWDGQSCSDNCHFPIASEALLWRLN